jgi:Ran GTPase-activating protein (RanGAP) involved in mRNA processing and transport
VLRWELGLRNPEDLNIAKLGVKSFILGRNNFTDYFAEKFALSLKGDEYLRFVDLRRNEISI